MNNLITELSTNYQDSVSHLRTKIQEQEKEIKKLQEQIVLLSYVKMYDV